MFKLRSSYALVYCLGLYPGLPDLFSPQTHDPGWSSYIYQKHLHSFYVQTTAVQGSLLTQQCSSYSLSLVTTYTRVYLLRSEVHMQTSTFDRCIVNLNPRLSGISPPELAGNVHHNFSATEELLFASFAGQRLQQALREAWYILRIAGRKATTPNNINTTSQDPHSSQQASAQP